MEKDVVCGMQVDPAKAAGTSQFNGKTYYFCSNGCKKKFDANPICPGGTAKLARLSSVFVPRRCRAWWGQGAGERLWSTRPGATGKKKR